MAELQQPNQDGKPEQVDHDRRDGHGRSDRKLGQEVGSVAGHSVRQCVSGQERESSAASRL